MSRERILASIRKNQPSPELFPAADLLSFREPGDLAGRFAASVESVGGKALFSARMEDLSDAIRHMFPSAQEVISLVEGVEGGSADPAAPASRFDKLDVAILPGEFGVAENGAVWLREGSLGHRSLPFIASHVIVVVRAGEIVENMHEAMARISGYSEGYGVFVSGPSKTADIEQSLVIGAQGPLSLTVVLVG
jgi:L-lactate dehydrogenase complex protein LldG